MAWQDDLQPASWRGVPFFVQVSEATFGRNTAVHVYPFKEKKIVWVEDLGAAPSLVHITGFVVGDDVRQQVLDLFRVMQQPSQAELVHPVYGSQIGSIVGGCRYVHRSDRGRYAEIAFEFIANKADAPYPAAQPDTGGQVENAAGDGQAAAAADFTAKAKTQPSSLLDRKSAGFNPRAGEQAGGV